MDKDSDESMAPALQRNKQETTKHHNFKLPLSLVSMPDTSSDKTLFDEVDEQCNVTDTKDSDVSIGSNPRFPCKPCPNLVLQQGNKGTTSPNNGSSGYHVMSVTSDKGDEHMLLNGKENHDINQSTSMTNGWCEHGDNDDVVGDVVMRTGLNSDRLIMENCGENHLMKNRAEIRTDSLDKGNGERDSNPETVSSSHFDDASRRSLSHKEDDPLSTVVISSGSDDKHIFVKLHNSNDKLGSDEETCRILVSAAGDASATVCAKSDVNDDTGDVSSTSVAVSTSCKSSPSSGTYPDTSYRDMDIAKDNLPVATTINHDTGRIETKVCISSFSNNGTLTNVSDSCKNTVSSIFTASDSEIEKFVCESIKMTSKTEVSVGSDDNNNEISSCSIANDVDDDDDKVVSSSTEVKLLDFVSGVDIFSSCDASGDISYDAVSSTTSLYSERCAGAVDISSETTNDDTPSWNTTSSLNITSSLDTTIEEVNLLNSLSTPTPNARLAVQDVSKQFITEAFIPYTSDDQCVNVTLSQNGVSSTNSNANDMQVSCTCPNSFDNFVVRTSPSNDSQVDAGTIASCKTSSVILPPSCFVVKSETDNNFQLNTPHVIETTLACDERISIPSSSVHSSKHQDSATHEEKSTEIISDFPLETRDMTGLVHGLMADNHVENLPLKLSNTLGDMTASLSSRGLSCTADDEQTQPESSMSELIPVSPLVEPEPEYVKEPTGIMLNAKVIENQHKLQFDLTNQRRLKLENRINDLQIRLNAIRAKGVQKYTKRQLKSLAASESAKNDSEGFTSQQRCHSFWKQMYELTITENTSERKEPDWKLFEKSRYLSESTGVLRKELLKLRGRCDPDQTESSSDEETLESFNLPQNQLSSSHNLKEHRVEPSQAFKNFSSIQNSQLQWARARAFVAPRWTWLQGQVSELEFKIRQHNELYRQLRSSKGKVLLADVIPSVSFSEVSKSRVPAQDAVLGVVSVKPSNSMEPRLPSNVARLVNNVKEQSSSVLDALPPLSVDNSPTSIKIATKANEIKESFPVERRDDSCTAARCRPLRYPLRRRKMVRASDIINLTKSFNPPTILNDNFIMSSEHVMMKPHLREDGKPINREYATMADRASRHDHSYHRILSMAEDIPLSLRLNSFMMARNKKMAEKLRRKHKKKKHKRKQEKQRQKAMKIQKNSTSVPVDEVDKLLGNIDAPHCRGMLENRSGLLERRKRRSKRDKALKLELDKINNIKLFDSDLESIRPRSDSGTSNLDSSLDHPQSQVVLKRKRKRPIDHTYDVDYIVIPSHTRNTIQKLQYKEIITPRWRAVDGTANEHDAPVVEQEVYEDETDASYKVRHDIYETIEKGTNCSYKDQKVNKRHSTRARSRTSTTSNSPVDPSLAFFFPLSNSSPDTSHDFFEFPQPSSPDILSSVAVRSQRSSTDQQQWMSLSSSIRSSNRSSVSSDDGAFNFWEKRTFPLNEANLNELTRNTDADGVESKSVDVKKNKCRPRSKRDCESYTNTASKHKKSLLIKELPSKLKQVDTGLPPIAPRNQGHLSDQSNSSTVATKHVRRVQNIVKEQTNRTTGTNILPRRHKPAIKDKDFYFYSELDPNSDMNTSSNHELISEDDAPKMKVPRRNDNMTSAGDWVAKPVSRKSSFQRKSDSDDDSGSQISSKIIPLLKIKKR